MARNVNDAYKSQNRWRAVLDHTEGTLVVNAGPGTGKTFSLLRKIEQLLNDGTDPDKIYYLTFVNSIVDAFKADVAKAEANGGLGRDADELGIRISTLHSLGFKVVKAYAAKLGLSEHIEVVEASKKPVRIISKLFVSDLYFLAKDDGVVSDKRGFKTALLRLQKAWQSGNAVPIELQGLDELVDKLSRKYEALSWDHLVLLANQAIESYGLPKWLKDAEHFMIDEYQDFNPAEQRLIDLVTEPSDSVVIVGDMDQSIYSGRSASPQGLQELLEHNHVSTVNFVYCRRCPIKVIEAANRMLELMDPNNFQDRALQAFKGEEGLLHISHVRSCKAELDLIAAEIKEHLSNGTTDIAILMPGRKGMDYYRDKLKERGINCVIHKTGNEEREMLSVYLRLAILKEQALLERVLLSTFPALERRFQRDVLPRMIMQDLSIVEALRAAELEVGSGWRNDVRQALQKFEEELKLIRSQDSNKLSVFLKEKGWEVPEDQLKEILDDEHDAWTVAERVDMIIKQLDHNKDEEETSDATVQLLTMHSSKGLSKSVVIMPALEDKWIPARSVGEALKEKHRLFYVALTRSEECMIITYPRTRARGDPLNHTPQGANEGPSRYLETIDNI